MCFSALLSVMCCRKREVLEEPDICGVGEREEWDDDESEWGEDSKWAFKNLSYVYNT
jgi:hypothetical protein